VCSSDLATALGKRTRWLQIAMGGKLAAVIKPADGAPPSPAALAEKQRLAEQDLKQWAALSEDWRAGRSNLLTEGQARIAAAQDGALATTSAGRAVIAQYRAAMLKEIELALSITELALKRSYAIDSGQVDAVSSATRKAAAAKPATP
jgi:hypothetical protein